MLLTVCQVYFDDTFAVYLGVLHHLLLTLIHFSLQDMVVISNDNFQTHVKKDILNISREIAFKCMNATRTH